MVTQGKERLGVKEGVFGCCLLSCDLCLPLVFQFLKRQDLLNVLARMMRPASDQVVRTQPCKLFIPSLPFCSAAWDCSRGSLCYCIASSSVTVETTPKNCLHFTGRKETQTADDWELLSLWILSFEWFCEQSIMIQDIILIKKVVLQSETCSDCSSVCSVCLNRTAQTHTGFGLLVLFLMFLFAFPLALREHECQERLHLEAQ